MTWVNEMEIDELVDLFREDPVLSHAAKYLSDYRDFINEVSDGWCYWSHGTRCAGTLVALLVHASYWKRGIRHLVPEGYVPPVKNDIVRAVGEIQQFVVGEPQLKGKIPPTLGGLLPPVPRKEVNWVEVVLGEHAMHAPGQLILQPMGQDDSGRHTTLIGAIVTSVEPLMSAEARERGAIHELIVGEIFIRPHGKFASRRFRGAGLNGLVTSEAMFPDAHEYTTLDNGMARLHPDVELPDGSRSDEPWG